MQSLTLFFLQMPILYYCIVISFGILIGSLLNLIIYRLPKMMENDFIQEMHSYAAENAHLNLPVTLSSKKVSINLFFPRSFCPSCQHTLSWWQNIPLFSYVFLKARCFYCQSPISFRYFFIEAFSGLALFACAYHFGVSWQALWAMIFSLTLITMTFIDIDHQILPDSLTLPLMWLGLILSLHEVFIPSQTAIIGASAGYLSLWAVYWAFKLITKKEGMGYGDFKLLAALGAWLGWQALPNILLISALLGIIVALTLRATKKLEAGNPISFGPYLAVAGWINLLWGEQINRFYFELLNS